MLLYVYCFECVVHSVATSMRVQAVDFIQMLLISKLETILVETKTKKTTTTKFN